MTTAGKRFFYLGILLALICGYLRARGGTAWLVPWLLVGGVGLICGAIYVNPVHLAVIFAGLIGVVIALDAILLQDYNPKWLAAFVFWARVFFAHFLLSFALLRLIKPTRDPAD